MAEAEATAASMAERCRELIRLSRDLAVSSQRESRASEELQRAEQELEAEFKARQAEADELLAKVRDRCARARDLLQKAGWVRAIAEVEMPPPRGDNAVDSTMDSHKGLDEAVSAFLKLADQFDQGIIIPSPAYGQYSGPWA